MRHKCLVLPVKKLLKSVHIYGSYRKIKTGVPFFGTPGTWNNPSSKWNSYVHHMSWIVEWKRFFDNSYLSDRLLFNKIQQNKGKGHCTRKTQWILCHRRCKNCCKLWETASINVLMKSLLYIWQIHRNNANSNPMTDDNYIHINFNNSDTYKPLNTNNLTCGIYYGICYL